MKCYTVKLTTGYLVLTKINKLHTQRLISDKDCVVKVLVIVSSILVQHSCAEPLQNHCYPYSTFTLCFPVKNVKYWLWYCNYYEELTAFICNMTVIVIKHFKL